MRRSGGGEDAQRLIRLIRAIQRGLRWLKESGDGLQDARDLAITIVALIATERNPHSHLVQRLSANLIRKQSLNGSWNDELWDTVWAAKALAAVDCAAHEKTLFAALRFIEGTRDGPSGTWYEEPFETMLVLDLLAATAPERLIAIAAPSLKWLASLQQRDGLLIGTRYTGMLCSLIRVMPRDLVGPLGAVAESAEKWLRCYLESHPIWTGAAWSNYYALNALLDGGATLEDPVVQKAVDWFLEMQDRDGRWCQVSQIHDTAMAVLVCARLLTAPLVDLSEPRTGVLGANRENGTIRISFQGPGAGAITPAERLKISDQVRADLGMNQQLIISALGRLRSHTPAPPVVGTARIPDELAKAGRYAYGHMIPPRIQFLLESSPADHLRLEIDERLIDLPWELIHDGTDFLCLRYAIGRRLISDQNFVASRRQLRRTSEIRALVVADPTSDLPAARQEGAAVAALLRDKCGMQVDVYLGDRLSKRDFLLNLGQYDIVHFAGHATYEKDSPDESGIVFADGMILAFEIARFIRGQAPAIVFLNACWSAEELRDPNSYSPMMRGLGRTLLYGGVTAFIGYLVPVPDESATRCAISFYEAVAQGHTIGESMRQARIRSRDPETPDDLTWSSAVLYGDPSVRAVEAVVEIP